MDSPPLVMTVLLWSGGTAREEAGAAGSSGPARAGIQAAYGRLPLAFEANRGQATPAVSFLARGLGYGLFLTPTGVVLTLPQPSPGIPSPQVEVQGKLAARVRLWLPPPSGSPEHSATSLRLRWLGGNPTPLLAGEEELPGMVNVFHGTDPTRWRTQIPTYAKVRYRDIYPGIDLVYYGTQRQVEHDFIVAPGADPTAIRLAVEGAEQLALTPEGSLQLTLAGGEIRLQRPRIYQEVEGRRRPVEGSYVLLPVPETGGATVHVGFTVAAYDPRIPLVIDPVLEYSTYLGGSGFDYASALAVDSSGNAYVAGWTSSSNFPTTAGAVQTTFGEGFRDAFVAKLNPTGTALVYATYLGGRDDDLASALAVDTNGNAYVAGSTYSSDFPTTAGALQTTFGGGFHDAFVAKIRFAGIPGAATLLAPSGPLATPTPAFTWTAVAEAEQYYLWVEDPTGLRVDQWYTAAQAGCGDGTGTCSVSPGVTLAVGGGQWRLRTWNSYGYGPYSSGLNFTYGISVPGAASLLSPVGYLPTPPSTFTWSVVGEAEHYYLWIQDSTGLKVSQWYTAAQAGCETGTGTCSVSPGVTLAAGGEQWRVRTWNVAGYGPYGGPLGFGFGLPAAATLLAPSGPLPTPTPPFTWTAVGGVEQYYLWVEDSTGLKVSQWVTAAQAGCGSGAGTCTVSPGVTLAVGGGQWRLRTWNPAGYGPYSSGLNFAYGISRPPAATLLAPTDTIGTAPTYSWQAVAAAEQYYLWVQDSTGLKEDRWLTAAQAGCGSGSGTCSVAASQALALGAASWRVRTWNAAGYGPYAGPQPFTVSGP